MSEIKAQPPFSGEDLEDSHQNGAVHDQLVAIKSYIAGNKTAEECSQDLIETIPKAIIHGWKENEDPDDSEDDYDPVYDAVYSLISNIQNLALANQVYQPAIVILSKAVQKLPPQTVQVPGQESQEIVWSEMPHIGAILTDIYEYQQYLFISSSSPGPGPVVSKWASINAWIARLVSTGINAIGGADYNMHRASCCFLRVLDVEGHPYFRGDLPAAANLFRYASPVLLRMCREETPSPEPPIGIFSNSTRELSEGKKVLWTKPGYSMDRWVWWKTRWGQLAVSSELDEGLRAHAREALTAMEAAEL